MNPYVNEFLSNLEMYRYKAIPLCDAESMRFFLYKDHQVASDEECYNEFMSIFPNFFEYRNHESDFVVLTNLFHEFKQFPVFVEYEDGDSIKFKKWLEETK